MTLRNTQAAMKNNIIFLQSYIKISNIEYRVKHIAKKALYNGTPIVYNF